MSNKYRQVGVPSSLGKANFTADLETNFNEAKGEDGDTITGFSADQFHRTGTVLSVHLKSGNPNAEQEALLRRYEI